VKWRDLFRRPTDHDRFAALVMRRAKERGWPHEIAYNRDEFRLDVGPKDAKVFLHNVFKDWSKADVKARQAEVDRIVATMFEIDDGDELDTALPQLLPTIRNRRELESYWLDPSTGIERGHWSGAYRPLCDALAISLAIDRPRSLAHVGSRLLSKWGVPFDALLERAILNLREISPASFAREPEGFYVSHYEDSYDCSRLLIPEIFDLLSLNGEPVAVAVARQGLVVAGSNDTSGLLAMARFVEEQLEKATRPVSYLPLVRKNGGWVAFDPVEPALALLRDLHTKQARWDYASQHEVLQEYCTRTSRDVFVADLQISRHGERTYSIATWGDGVRTLLPRTDAVAVFRGERFFVRYWDDFWSICGDVLVDEGLYPVRFLTPEALDSGRLDRLEHEFARPDWLPPTKGA
jgi:hypothetical protein